MNRIDLKLIPSKPRTYSAEPPSYFEYYAARTLSGDKKLKQFRADLLRSYQIAQLEDEVRRNIARRRAGV